MYPQIINPVWTTLFVFLHYIYYLQEKQLTGAAFDSESNSGFQWPQMLRPFIPNHMQHETTL